MKSVVTSILTDETARTNSVVEQNTIDNLNVADPWFNAPVA